MAHDPTEVDRVTGQTTTGHSWDDIRELNTPLPRWWLWTFYACIAFAIGYWIVYPAWPGLTGYTRGLFGYSSRESVAADLVDIQTLRRQQAAGLEKASVDDIAKDAKLQEVALAAGKAAFGDNCAPCHGAGGAGHMGYPNLTAGRWLWGSGSLDDIDTTITHGIRADYDKDTRLSAMPAFGKDGILKPQEISQVVAYVGTLSAPPTPAAAGDVEAGKKLFADNCAACHGDDGKGNPDLGAANLTSPKANYLYGADPKNLTETVTYARNSTMPAWGARLDPVTIKSLAIYVHSLAR